MRLHISAAVLVGEDEEHIERTEIADGFKSGVLLFELTDHTAHLCVLTTVDDSVTTEVLADLVQLVGSDIVNPRHEDGFVGVEVILQFLSEDFFAFALFFGGHFCLSPNLCLCSKREQKLERAWDV